MTLAVAAEARGAAARPPAPWCHCCGRAITNYNHPIQSRWCHCMHHAWCIADLSYNGPRCIACDRGIETTKAEAVQLEKGVAASIVEDDATQVVVPPVVLVCHCCVDPIRTGIDVVQICCLCRRPHHDPWCMDDDDPNVCENCARLIHEHEITDHGAARSDLEQTNGIPWHGRGGPHGAILHTLYGMALELDCLFCVECFAMDLS